MSMSALKSSANSADSIARAAAIYSLLAPYAASAVAHRLSRPGSPQGSRLITSTRAIIGSGAITGPDFRPAPGRFPPC